MARVNTESPITVRIAEQFMERGLVVSHSCNLRSDVPVFENVEDLRWKGPRPSFEDYCQRMRSRDLLARVRRQTQ